MTGRGRLAPTPSSTPDGELRFLLDPVLSEYLVLRRREVSLGEFRFELQCQRVYTEPRGTYRVLTSDAIALPEDAGRRLLNQLRGRV